MGVGREGLLVTRVPDLWKREREREKRRRRTGVGRARGEGKQRGLWEKGGWGLL
jgi:hypothetical protein